MDSRIDTDRAISLGIIVTELVTNALRHAYPDRSGQVRVFLQDVDATSCQLVVEDDGIGLPAGQRSASIGSRIVDGMAKRLGSKLESEKRDIGSRLVLRFPKSNLMPAES
jgi:two-component sensor histidine kinase